MTDTPNLLHLVRQWDIIPAEVLDNRINVIGAGAIGSCTVLALSKMGFTDIHVWDFDTIEIENMNCQFYRHSDIGKLKVEALREIVKAFSNEDLTVYPERYEGEIPLPGVVITPLDSMSARKKIWDAHKAKSLATSMYIDPRMSAETCMCYAMNPMDPDDIAAYEKTLYSDARAMQERCTAKSTMYTAFLLSGHVAKVVKDFFCRQPYARNMQWCIKGYDMDAWKAGR